MTTYEVNVTREDRWWIITVPSLAGYVTASGAINVGGTTQARRFADISREAVDFIATVTDSPISAIELNVSVEVDGVNVSRRAAKVREDRAAAERLADQARSEARALARELAADGVAVRDVGEVLGVSFQRAQQLINT